MLVGVPARYEWSLEEMSSSDAPMQSAGREPLREPGAEVMLEKGKLSHQW